VESRLPFERRWQAEQDFIMHLRHNHPDDVREHSEILTRIIGDE
jgi:hypothetical protein